MKFASNANIFFRVRSLKISRLKALTLLSECTGDDIWSLEHCESRGLPKEWIAELSDCFESGFQTDSQTIYIGDTIVNQYQGIRDVDLAMKIGKFLGVDVASLQLQAPTRALLVRAITEHVEED